MFRLLLFTLALVNLNEASLSNLHLVVPDDSYTVLSSGKLSASSLRGSSSVSLSNAISAEDTSNSVENEEQASEEASAAPSAAVSAPSPAPASGAPAQPTSAPAAASPAGVNRARPSSNLSGLSSVSLSRPSVLVSSSTTAQASASSPLVSARSSTTIQHRILPAETIPLPITISQRPGLRTVIAPETITIQQPIIARVGEVVQQIPTAVSHQRQTVVHKHARVVTPIVAPAVRTLTSQIVRAYHTPLVYAPQVTTN
ncbi:mucin-7 [Musca domestica]|uniref:Mucin-7 n=1 Tax=Musca domestica TaxID=7370 RepID=A0A1I8MRL4_MUSDO|nr:mucin-7 [Musca domestica]